MVFSKSLGYAVRSLLYVALAGEGKKIQLVEIAKNLNIPKHFLAKVMKKLVKENILCSMKGPYGGFYLNENSTATTLCRLMHITGENEKLKSCILKLKKCHVANPCPMHHQVQELREQWKLLLQQTTIHDILAQKKDGTTLHISFI